MFRLQQWLWIAAITVLPVAPAAAQQGGIGSGGATATGGQIGATGGGGGSGGGFGNTSGGFGNSGGGFGNSNSNSSSSSSLSAPNIPTLQTTNSNLQKSNVFAGYYSNPTAMGYTSGSGSSAGAFGSPSFGTSNSNNTNSNRSSLGGSLNNSSSSNQSGILVPIQSQINYSALLRFPARPAPVTAIRAELRTAIDGTSMIANPKDIQIITDQNDNVTLRGTVQDDDEARLVEGIVRLTPGVGAIKNELKPAFATAGR